METYHLTVESKGNRLDKHIASHYPQWSRSVIQQWIEAGMIKVNGAAVKSNYKVVVGDEIVIQEKEEGPVEILPEQMDLEIVYEDDDVLVVNKPRGMVVHPAPGHSSGTLVNGLMAHTSELSTLNGELRPGIVHRIDKDTSGLLMVAKNNDAHESLVEQLKNQETIRKYVAIVSGVVPHDKGTIEAPIGRDPDDRQSMTVTEKNSKNAVTHFHVLERFNDYTYLQCELETGRTHQIRVHMKYIGFPIVCDPKYGPRKKHDFPISGQALHAEEISFTHPRTEEILTFKAEIPEDLTRCLTDLRQRTR